MPPRTTKRRTTNLKTKKQPEVTEYRTVWKSDNQGVKEETFIQTSRRDGDGQLGRSGLTARQQLEDRATWWLADWAVPHSRADKPGGTTGEQDRPCNPGFQ